MNLTDHTLKRLRVEVNKRITYSDDALPGFGVRVTPNGAKSFVLLVGRQRKRLTIGRYPLISLKEARARARELIAERILGKDDVPSMKFEDAIPIFLASRYGENYIKPRTRNEVERLLKRHFLPKFRYEQLSVIKPHEIATTIDSLRRTPSIAHHAFGAIRLFFRWAEARRYVLRSPCATLQPPKPSRPRERVLTAEEVRAVLRAAKTQSSTFATIVELLLLTGQRRSEIAGLRAEWIDWEARTITFPGTITKNRRTHVLPFGERIGALLSSKKKTGLLFPGRGTDQKRPFDGWSKCKPKFDALCNIAPWRLHDLRRTFATNLAALGIPVHVTEKLLNHVSGTMSGIVSLYQRHSYQEEMREAIRVWESRISQLLKD